MDGFSVGEASALLGVPAPRIYRAAERDGLARAPASRLHLSSQVVAKWLRAWGWVPEPLRDRCTREEAFVLAALSRSPLGLRSARSVARRAVLSPSTATKALSALKGAALVRERTERVVEGRVSDIVVWCINWWSPEWKALATAVPAVVLPASKARPRRQRTVPSRFAHLFWNEDTGSLELERDGVMIAERILRSSDVEAIAWAAAAIPPESLRRVKGLRNVPARVAALAEALAGEP
ncbi:MAG: hypothetical protein ACRD1K_09730 [Acidimicrobiales bacterium]